MAKSVSKLSGQVSKNKTKVEQALSIFSTLIKDITKAQEEMTSVVVECENSIKGHKETQLVAQQHIQEYDVLLKNVKSILGEK
jgi:predicted peptidase